MELSIKTQKENKLLNRSEIEAQISYQNATPSMAEVKKAIASHSKSDESNVVVKYIKGGFGHTSAHVSAFVYADKKAFDMSELIKKKPKKKAEAGADAPPKKK